MSTEGPKRIVFMLWFVVGGAALALAVLIGPVFFPLWVSSDHSTVHLTRPFALTDQNGRTITEQDFRSRPTAWFFGFTHCPDVCPTTLANLTMVLQRLGRDADKLTVVFVTVDPERDTPEVLKAYLSSFDPRIVGLTGSREAIAAMTRGYFVHQAKVAQADGSYTMEHTAKVLMTAADGRFAGTLDPQEPIDSQVRKLRKLIREK